MGQIKNRKRGDTGKDKATAKEIRRSSRKGGQADAMVEF